MKNNLDLTGRSKEDIENINDTIEIHKEHCDLTKGFFWQIDKEQEPEEGFVLFNINPKDIWEKEKCLYDQSIGVQVFFKNEILKQKVNEDSEGYYSFEGTEKELKALLKQEVPFFQQKKMFS